MLCITMSLMTVQDSELGPGNCQLERSKLLHRFTLLIVTLLSKSYLVCCKQVLFLRLKTSPSKSRIYLSLSYADQRFSFAGMKHCNTELCTGCIHFLSINRYDSPSSYKMFSFSVQFLLPFPHTSPPKQGLPSTAYKLFHFVWTKEVSATVTREGQKWVPVSVW